MLCKRSGVFTDVTTAGLKDQVPFHRAVQLEIGQEFCRLLDVLAEEGYEVEFRAGSDGAEDVYPESRERVADCLDALAKDRTEYCFHIRKYQGRSENNDRDLLLPYLKQEFEKLMDIYRFVSWHPRTNDFIGI